MCAFHPAFLTALLTFLCVSSACQKPAKTPAKQSTSTVAAPQKPERELRPAEKARLQELQAQSSSLKDLVKDMKAVVDTLKDRERSERAFAKATRKLSPDDLKMVLTKAKAMMTTSPKGLALSGQAKSIDSRLKTLMGKATLDADAHSALKREKTQIEELQRTVTQLAPGTNAAFRAHSLLLQSESALELLRKE